ncbi:unnamed protein product [marine sediment metagenome]|uniref:Uncharacterized protein n=1 Tax=marine sediment metagenome TaxID=412755 RepID=X1EW68_9ZZZZ
MSKTKDLSGVEIRIGLSAKDLISAIKKLNGEDREFLVENLLAATNPEYLESIKEARKNYKQGRTISHNDEK